jgi:hypothetical protein
MQNQNTSPKGERMIETYRMLGREHEADLAREAKRRQQASLVPVKVRRRRRPAPIHRWDLTSQVEACTPACRCSVSTVRQR